MITVQIHISRSQISAYLIAAMTSGSCQLFIGNNLIVLLQFLEGCVLTSAPSPHDFDPMWWFCKMPCWLNKQSAAPGCAWVLVTGGQQCRFECLHLVTGRASFPGISVSTVNKQQNNQASSAHDEDPGNSGCSPCL